MSFDVNSLAPELLEILREQGAEFVQQNRGDVQVLGEDAVRAILSQSYIDRLPAIPNLTGAESVDQCADIEEALAQRRAVLQLVATAEAQDAARVAALRANAVASVEKLGLAVGTVAAGAAVKALLQK